MSREPCIETVKDPHIEAYCNTTKSVGLILFVFPASLNVCLAMPSLAHIVLCARMPDLLCTSACLPCACLTGTTWLPYFAHPISWLALLTCVPYPAMPA